MEVNNCLEFNGFDAVVYACHDLVEHPIELAKFYHVEDAFEWAFRQGLKFPDYTLTVVLIYEK